MKGRIKILQGCIHSISLGRNINHIKIPIFWIHTKFNHFSDQKTLQENFDLLDYKNFFFDVKLNILGEILDK